MDLRQKQESITVIPVKKVFYVFFFFTFLYVSQVQQDYTWIICVNMYIIIQFDKSIDKAGNYIVEFRIGQTSLKA